MSDRDTLKQDPEALINPADVVEIPADLVVVSVLEGVENPATETAMRNRVDWWLEEGGDECV